MTRPPIFILGVPRSGTTLLRTLLDSHSAIACGPETPWLGGHQPRSVMELWRFLREHEKGYCASYRMSPNIATEAARGLVSTLMDRYAAARGKSRWAEKTPDNILHIPFLLELFPEARVLLITRNGPDVALSTSTTAEHRKGISPFLEQNLSFGPGVPVVQNNPLTAILRWRHWNNLAAQALHGREHLPIAYEHLVTEPQTTMQRVTEFIGEPFEPSMLDYAKFGHEFPGWEWGSADVRARGTITTSRIGQARKEFSPAQLALLDPIAGRAPAPDPGDAVISLAASQLSDLSIPLGLGRVSPEQAKEWVHDLSLRNWVGQSMTIPGEGKNPTAWAAGLLGGHGTFTGPGPDPALARLRDNLRVRIDWQKPA